MYALYLIPITLILFLAGWMWALADTLRNERSHGWLIFLLVLPPIAIFVYALNFLLLGDERYGVGAYVNQQRNQRRIGELRELLKTDDIRANREELVQALMKAQRWEEALEELKPLLDRDPEDVDLQYRTARCLTALGKDEAALPHLDYIFEESPGWKGWEASLEYAAALERLQRFPDALAVYDRVSQSLSIPEVVVRRARVLAKLDRKSEAIEDLEKVIHDFTSDAGIHENRDRPWVETARKWLQQLKG